MATEQLSTEPLLPEPLTEEEKALAARYRADVERLRKLHTDANKLGEISATLFVNFGPNGRVWPGVLPESGLSPLQQLMEVLFALSVETRRLEESLKVSDGRTSSLVPPTWENHVVDVAPCVLFTPQRLDAMGLDHICMLQNVHTQYKRCRYRTRELFDAAVTELNRP